MSQKKNEGILFPAEIRVVGSYTDCLLNAAVDSDVGHDGAEVVNILPNADKGFYN